MADKKSKLESKQSAIIDETDVIVGIPTSPPISAFITPKLESKQSAIVDETNVIVGMPTSAPIAAFITPKFKYTTINESSNDGHMGSSMSFAVQHNNHDIYEDEYDNDDNDNNNDNNDNDNNDNDNDDDDNDDNDDNKSLEENNGAKLPYISSQVDPKYMADFLEKMKKYVEKSDGNKPTHTSPWLNDEPFEYDTAPYYFSKIKKDENSDESNIEMTTDGLQYDEMKKYIYVQKKNLDGHRQCNICLKYFPDMIITDQFDGSSTCWHCLFFLNADDISRIEQMYQISQQSYIEFCGHAHNKEKCIRSDSCILCMANNGNSFAEAKWTDPDKVDQFIDNIKNDINDKNLDNEIDFGISI